MRLHSTKKMRDYIPHFLAFLIKNQFYYLRILNCFVTVPEDVTARIM